MLVPTVRIPELAGLTTGLPLSLTDKIPIWISSEDKTRKVDLQALNTFFGLGGGGGAHPPVVFGAEMIYIVPASAAGTAIASIPSIAGLDFTLERGGLPLIALLPDLSNAADAEYEILDAGGFQLLKSGDQLILDERFKLTIFSLIGGGPGGTTVASFIQGKKVVSTNTTLDAVADINKIVQVRSGSTPVTITLPSVDDIAENSFIPIDTTVNSSKPTAITTSGGQLIYFNGTSRSTIYMMPGEVCWLFRDEDGFYVINDFAERYKTIAEPKASFKAGLNQLVCNGQEVNRADWPRLWELIQTLGSSLVSDATWNTATQTVSGRTVNRPYRGCFSTGDGSSTFRVPDMMGMTLTSLISESGSDPQRFLNKAGGYQDDTTKKFWAGTITTLNILKVDGNDTEIGTDNIGPTSPNIRTGVAIDQTLFADKNRVENVGVLWVINT